MASRDAAIRKFILDRDHALLSLDQRKIMAFSKRYGAPLTEAMSDDEFWMGVHKARSGIKTLPRAAREASCQWLMERGETHWADDL